MAVILDSLLMHSSDVHRGRARVVGTGITVHRIALLWNLGHSPGDIVRKYRHLTLAGVHAALDYYHANREQIDAEIAADQSEAVRLEAEFARAPQAA